MSGAYPRIKVCRGERRLLVPFTPATWCAGDQTLFGPHGASKQNSLCVIYRYAPAARDTGAGRRETRRAAGGPRCQQRGACASTGKGLYAKTAGKVTPVWLHITVLGWWPTPPYGVKHALTTTPPRLDVQQGLQSSRGTRSVR